MRKRLGMFFLATALLSSSAYASFSNECCEEYCDSYCNRWKLGAEFLYFLPTFDDTYFVLESPDDRTDKRTGTRRNNDFNFRPGFRVGGALELCNCSQGEFQVFYTHLRCSHKKTVRGDFLWATIGSTAFAGDFEEYTGTASSNLNFLYQRVDGLYSHPFWCNNNYKINGFFGLEYANLRLKEHYEFAEEGSTPGIIRQNARTWGIGPELGFNFDYLICRTPRFCCGALSLVANSSASLLASKTRTSDFNSIATGDIVTDVTDQTTWRVVPALHARIGLNYAACFSRFTTNFEIGYEFNSYIRGLTRLAFPDDVAPAITYTHYYNFDMQGLYVGLNVEF